jgi:hypothetical protein
MSIDEQSIINNLYSFFFLKTFLSQLLVLSSDSLVLTTQSRRKAKSQSPTMITIPHRLSYCLYRNLTYRHWSDSHSTNQRCICYTYLQFLTLRSHLSLTVAARPQYLLSFIHRFHTHQHRRCLRLSILFLHRADSDAETCGPPPGVEMGWNCHRHHVVHFMFHHDFFCGNF